MKMNNLVEFKALSAFQDVVQYHEKTVMLADGSPIVVRAIRPQDAPRLYAMFTRLSRQSIHMRFMGARKFSYRDIRSLCNVDQQQEMRLIAVSKYGAIVGETEYVKIKEPDSDTAEFAILIEDAYQGRGVGKLLFHELIAHARAAGISTFLIVTNAQNKGTIKLVKGSGYAYEVRMEGNTLEFYLSLNSTRITADHELKRAS